MTRQSAPGWPAHLRPGAVRFGRASRHFEMTITFYRDLVGLPVVDEFTGSFGEDGIIFGLPDTAVQLEIIRAHEPAAAAAAFDPLVLYPEAAGGVPAPTKPWRAAGRAPPPAQHPYWVARGAAPSRAPDGREVIFPPWVYGRDPEPTDPHRTATS